LLTNRIMGIGDVNTDCQGHDRLRVKHRTRGASIQ
jgi:hypothetical protein